MVGLRRLSKDGFGQFVIFSIHTRPRVLSGSSRSIAVWVVSGVYIVETAQTESNLIHQNSRLRIRTIHRFGLDGSIYPLRAPLICGHVEGISALNYILKVTLGCSYLLMRRERNKRQC